ncbi:hypothetical protein FA95DRAFT_1504627 [Auriscalpium vulgare]|uniref:Uncharacterized protein n=1 Tax=Auriscalpium vulgare TaxID=40419 RepID=A0ACB8R6F8_9AGAM|nr:hypothetical protein FA95DRAFT_1504627 [Auriscalpium vulgare]
MALSSIRPSRRPRSGPAGKLGAHSHPRIACPNSKRLFASQAAVSQHLSQPCSQCASWLPDQLARLLFRQPDGLGPTHATSDRTPSPAADSLHIPSAADNLDFDFSVPSMDMPVSGLDDAAPPEPSEIHVAHPNEPVTFGRGKTFLDRFHSDQFDGERDSNPYYPFSCHEDWEFGFFLAESSLSNDEIDALLRLYLMARLAVSFHTAKQLRSKVELLPSGPRWKSKAITLPGYATKSPMKLFYRDSLECLEHLFGNPLFDGHMDYRPKQVYTAAEHAIRVFSEWMTGDVAWKMQNHVPKGATVVGAVLSSDKTNLTLGTGNRVAHPLLLSLANLHMDFRMKSSHNTILLIALLPCPHFLCPKKFRGVLKSRVTHMCLDIVCEPLKAAARFGRMMADPLRHEPRTASLTLAQLHALSEASPDPWNLSKYVTEAKKRRFNGVHQPFWSNWHLSDPSHFLTPEPLHQWHKFCWDHDITWCRNVVGDAEINFRFSVLQPRVGFRHFSEGVSHLKQVTGREHRDIQRYLVACIAGAASPAFVTCIRALMEFRYLSQSPSIDTLARDRIAAKLSEFHQHKQVIIDSRARRGKANKIIDNWHIPKLELMQSVVPSIQEMGAPIQWTADVTERSHITLVKNPFRSSNRRDFDSQICRYLDREEKCRSFDMALALQGLASARHEDAPSGTNEDDLDPSVVVDAPQTSWRRLTVRNYFKLAALPSPSQRTLSTASTAFHLNLRPAIAQVTVDEAASLYNLPDLRPALVDYMTRRHQGSGPSPYVIGGRRAAPQRASLPFDHLEVWHNVRIQTRSVYGDHPVLPPQNVHACPPSESWPYGRCDNALVIDDPSVIWPGHGIRGILKMILRPIMRNSPTAASATPYLVYAQRLDIVSQGPAVDGWPVVEPATGMYVLKRATRADKTYLGDVIPLSQIRLALDVVPRFGDKADSRLTARNSKAFSQEFYLNKYVDKEIFATVF